MAPTSLHEAYRRSNLARVSFIVVLAGCALAFSIIGLGVGPMKFGIRDIAGALANTLLGCDFNVSDAALTVIPRIRLPRIVLGLLGGFGLAISGMQMQVILRNPLASPFTLGVASGAALGAGLAIIAGMALVGGKYFLIANAFLFSLIPCAVVYLLSRSRPSGYGMLILAGIAMNFIFDSVSMLLSYFSDSEELKSLSLWLMGNLGRATWEDIGPLAIVLCIATPLLFMQNQKLNVLSGGDESARGLGVNVERTRIVVLTLTSLVSASIICFTGIIGFVGLVSPHIVRMLIGNDARYLMPASGLFGAAFLVGADIISLRILEPAVLPVGIITSFVGGPMLLYLIMRKQREGAW
ncbi:MAG: iron ABC transporter permease [Chitinispirillaceae bacterium]|nr:iron ABC transporter permease [Chitinispirillaceae bacterium]